MNKVVRGIYENGELRFAEPVNIDGCWKVEITFVEREDTVNTPFNADPHLPERPRLPNRLEEIHRTMEDQKPHIGPF